MMVISTDEGSPRSSWIRRQDSPLSCDFDHASNEKIRKTMTNSSSLLRIRRVASSSLLAVLLLVLLPNPIKANFHKSEHEEQFPISGIAQAVWRKFVSPPSEEETDNHTSMNDVTPTPQPIKVIGAGLGRTGTSSFVRALEILGFKSYHFQDGMVDTPGHVEMFQKHAKQVVKGGEGVAAEIIRGISSAGFNATADYPTCLLYRELMEAYPDAKVVLTVRGPSSSSGGSEGISWAKSMETVLKVSHVQARRIPWRLLPTMRKLYDIGTWYLPDVQLDPATKLPNRNEMAQAYDKHVQEVIATVPPERLLVFAPTDGWKPLCDFLSPLDTIIETNCNKLLTEGTPYPFVNDKEDVERIELFFWLIATICESLLLIIGLFCQWKVFRLLFGSKTQNGSTTTTKRPKQE